MMQGHSSQHWQQAPKGRTRRPLIALALVFMGALVSVGFLAWTVAGNGAQLPLVGSLQSDPAPGVQEAQEVVAEFISGLEAASLGAIEFAGSDEVNDSVASAISDYRWATEGLEPFALSAISGPVVIDDLDPSQASAPLSLSWQFENGLTWETDTQIDLVLEQQQWRVRWASSVLAPGLNSGDQLLVRDLEPERGSILDRNGIPLVGQLPVVHVGVEPQRTDDPALLSEQLAQILGIDAEDLRSRIEAADPTHWVDVITLPREVYDTVKPEIFPLPGTVFRESIEQRVAEENLARALLGRSGEVTAEILENNPGVFEIGDIVGRSGLQFQYNAEMAGRAGMAIEVLRRAPVSTSTTTDTGLTTTSAELANPEPEPFAVIEPVHGLDIVTTLDPAAQRGAEAALHTTELPSALVAIQVSTGEIIAAANGPAGNPNNLALTGQFPPGSIFKIVTAYSLLSAGANGSDPAPCPPTAEVDGRQFVNAAGEALGPIDLSTAFVHSCNTSFIGLTTNLADDQLARAAAQFGIGVKADLGTPAFLGSVPATTDSVDLAATSFGQGRSLMSPLAAAVMASTVADGVYRTPKLITSPAPQTEPVAEVLEPGAVGQLQAMMRAVVTEGTASSVASVASPGLHGKTGTAEFGSGDPPPSHAWFVGYEGDVAFAVFVEGGEFGGAVAAPIAVAFLSSLG